MPSEFKTCPICGSVHEIKDHETIEREFEAGKFYYEVGGGIAWNLQDHIVCFDNQDSARKFKDRYPEFEVRYSAKS